MRKNAFPSNASSTTIIRLIAVKRLLSIYFHLKPTKVMRISNLLRCITRSLIEFAYKLSSIWLFANEWALLTFTEAKKASDHFLKHLKRAPSHLVNGTDLYLMFTFRVDTFFLLILFCGVRWMLCKIDASN